MQFAIGAIVRIIPDTLYYRCNEFDNPIDVDGVVVEYLDEWEFKYRVKWPATANIYRDCDLMSGVVLTEADVLGDLV